MYSITTISYLNYLNIYLSDISYLMGGQGSQLIKLT